MIYLSNMEISWVSNRTCPVYGAFNSHRTGDDLKRMCFETGEPLIPGISSSSPCLHCEQAESLVGKQSSPTGTSESTDHFVLKLPLERHTLFSDKPK